MIKISKESTPELETLVVLPTRSDILYLGLEEVPEFKRRVLDLFNSASNLLNFYYVNRVYQQNPGLSKGKIFDQSLNRKGRWILTNPHYFNLNGIHDCDDGFYLKFSGHVILDFYIRQSTWPRYAFLFDANNSEEVRGLFISIATKSSKNSDFRIPRTKQIYVLN